MINTKNQEREIELRNRLRPGQKKLSIWGAKSYLKYLRNSLENEFLVAARTEIQEEINKYNIHLKQLEKLHNEVKQYLEDVAFWLKFRESLKDNETKRLEIERLKQEQEKYTKILSALTHQ